MFSSRPFGSSSAGRPEGRASQHDQTSTRGQGIRTSRKPDPRVWRPFTIFLGPIPVLAFCWILFIVTWTHPVPMADYLASIIYRHPQSATMVAAVVATLLAGWTTYFFSAAVRYVIVVHLAMGYTQLQVLTSAVRIAQRSLWFNDPGMKWTWIVGLSWIGVSLQASALTSFLSLRQTQIPVAVSGADVNILDPELMRMVGTRPQFDNFYNELSSFYLQYIMINTLQLKKNMTGTFNFGGYTYTNTTSGTRPCSFISIKHPSLEIRSQSTIPANLDGLLRNRHISLPFEKTMTLQQQGFTADVSCRLNDPKDLERYPGRLIERAFPNSNITMAQLAVRCPGETAEATSIRPVTYLDPNSSPGVDVGVLFAVQCPDTDTFSHDMIIRGLGSFSVLNQTVCTVTPKVTTVNVEYHYSGPGLEIPTIISVKEPITQTGVPVWGEMALNMLLFNIVLGQSTFSSIFGNAWLLTVDRNDGDITINEALNTYIQAAVEFSGTIIRYMFAQSDSIYIPGGWNNLTPTMRAPVNGTLIVTTYAWSQDRTVSPLLLLPTTVIISATYTLLIYGLLLARKHKDVFLEEDADFDPTDIVHVVAAHAPETRRAGFKRFSDQASGYTQGTSVRMRTDDRLAVRGFEVVGVPLDGYDGNEHVEIKPDVQDSGTILLRQE